MPDRYWIYGMRGIFLFLLLTTNNSLLWGQEPVMEFDSPPFDHPISQSWINGIYQSKDGFTWLGTTNGLVRFDGYTYKTYIHNPKDTNSLSDNWVTEILEDKYGRLWVATDGGGISVYLPDQDVFRAYQHRLGDPTSLSNDRVIVGAYGSDETLWFGTQQGGLNRMDLRNQSFTHYRHHPGEVNSLSDDRVWAVWEDSLNREVWIGTRGGLDRLDLSSGLYKHYRFDPKDPSSLSFNFIMSVTKDFRDRIWVGTRSGLNLYDPETDAFTRFMHKADDPHSLLNSYVFDVFEDSQRRLWIAVDGGLSLWNESAGNFYNYPALSDQVASLKSGTVWKTYEDPEGRLWISTYGGGYSVVHRYKKKMEYYRLPFNDPVQEANNWIIRFIENPSGNLWVASWSGLHQFDLKTKTFRRLDTPQLKGAEWPIFGVTTTKEGLFVFIGPNGYMGFDPITEQFLPDYFQGQAPTAIPTSITTDRDGTLWMFSNQTSELFQRDPRTGQWTLLSRKANFPVIVANCLFIDNRNQLWIGADGSGLFKWSSDSQTVTQYTHDPSDPASISSNFIHTIYEDSHKNLWIGTRNGGLNLLLTDEGAGKFRNWDRFNSDLSSNVIQSILEDEYDQLWLGADDGIYCFNPREKRFTPYGVRDGLYSYGAWSSVALKTADSTLLFGIKNGFNLIHPDQIEENIFKPKVVITDFLLFDQSVPVRGSFTDTLDFPSPLEKNISFVQKIELKWWQNDVAFEFAALNYTLPEKNQYLYRLEGHQEEWVETTADHRRATFTNLDPGKYTFHVLASNNDGLWNEKGALIDIEISPPWWMTWWAYTLFGVTIIGLIYLYLHLQFKRRLAIAKANHLEEIDLAKTRLYTNISHEFRTPITIISGMAQQIGEAPERWFREGLDMIRQNARQLLNLVNQMLELHKLEAGALPLNYRQGDMVSFLRQLIEPFAWQAQLQNIQLHFLPNKKEIWMDFDPEKLTRIVSNLLSNAIKFTPAEGNIYVQTDSVNQHDNAHLMIKVKDTGIGIAADQLPYIFDRFYQVPPADTENHSGSMAGGTGIGLALISELVKLLQGKITVESEPGQGTAFTLYLPIRNVAPVIHSSENENLAKTIMEVAPIMVGLRTPPAETALLSDPHKQHPLVLIVEDNTDLITYLKACLREEYWIETATEGVTGRTRAIELIPDIVISDIMMPGIDGFELCSILKKDERTNHIPIILLTAKADHFSRLTGLEAGADSYLTKPFDPEELLITMKNLLTVREQIRQHYLLQVKPPADSNTDQTFIEKTWQEDPLVLKVRKLIEARIDDFDLKVKDLCEELHLSHSQLHRKLTAICGLSPNRFIRLVRLQRARDLLLNPNLSITAVAFDTGFQDPDYFSKVFREIYDHTPTDFRHAHGL